jgi:hypothetical protein
MKPPRKPLGGLGHYVLGPDGRTPLLEEDFGAWAMWFEKSGEARRVARTELPGGVGFISTVFLGLDHSFNEPRGPVLFETMCFIGAESVYYFDRYCTWAAAEAGHARIVRRALAQIERTAAQVADALVPAPAPEGGETT